VFEKSPVAFLDELAQDVGGTKRWWADLARDGKIPARKVGGHWCLTPEDLAEALESFRRNVSPVPQPIDDDLGLTETARRRTRHGGGQKPPSQATGHAANAGRVDPRRDLAQAPRTLRAGP
jgi:excisionase family DNA binding protein